MKSVKKLTLTALFVAIAVVGSFLQFPMFGAKCAPVQHLVNVLSVVILGPGYAVLQAFLASLIRNLLGLGTIFAFPGSMVGALLGGILYYFIKKLPAAWIGEVVGTGIIGGFICYPISVLLLGNKVAATAFVIAFLPSTAVGTIIAAIITLALKKSGALGKMISSINGEDKEASAKAETKA